MIRGAVATLEALLEHSDDLAKPIWSSQKRLAKLAHVSGRIVQRHLQELRDAGYLPAYVYAPQRVEASGRYRWWAVHAVRGRAPRNRRPRSS